MPGIVLTAKDKIVSKVYMVPALVKLSLAVINNQ